MSSPTSPTVSRRWLAREMKRLRIERGLQQPDVAKALACRVPKVSLIENGQRPLHDADLKTLLELFQVPEAEHQLYLDELANTQEKRWWDLYDDDTVPDWHRDFIGLEQGADRIRAYQPAVVHGLLQIPQYATEILRGMILRLSPERCSRLVDVRLRRQRRLLDGPGVPKLDLVLDESVLHRRVGDQSTMRAQLRHVVDTCGEHDNIEVRIVPFDRGGAPQAALGAFTIFNFPLPGDPGGVYTERGSSAAFVDDLPDIYEHSEMFEALHLLALSPAESLAMLTSSAEAHGG